MQARLRSFHALQVDRESVRLLLRHLDPEGVESRRRGRLLRRRYINKGPNYLFHIDGWDKLKPFGLTVHGCIDGFSRRIMWLEASRSNNDPYQVCTYFCKLLLQMNGLPHIVRADRGNENVNIERIQRILRGNNEDDRSLSGTTFLYGRSVANQRIESWWSNFPALGMDAWIQHMKTIEAHGILDCSSILHIELIRYIYLGLLRTELTKVKSEWNSHHIRTTRTAFAPSGKPDVMYHFPEAYDSSSYLKPVDLDAMEPLSTLACHNIVDCIPLYKELFDSVVTEHELTTPTTLIQAAQNFAVIADVIEDELDMIRVN